MKRKIFLISGSILLVALLLIIVLVFAKPNNTQASNPCKKQFYTNNDIVGYFRDVSKNESYYITSDWCVVKAILWWGSVFEHYSPIEVEITGNINTIFPEKQVYYGLIPDGFLDNGHKEPQGGRFYTIGLKSFGYFINDDPFKNIFGNNYPQPPRFVDNTKLKTVEPPIGSVASIIMQRMDNLHKIFSEDVVAAGKCKSGTISTNLLNVCEYLSSREQSFVPPSYKAFGRATGITPR